MPDEHVVLVTGASGYWGRSIAKTLLELPGFRVLGVDSDKPEQVLKGLDFIQADVRNPLLYELLQAEGVQTVCHMAWEETRLPSEAAFDYNVMGTIKVCGACAEAGVKKLILRSSTEVYGARPDNSAFMREDHPLRGSPAIGNVRDLMEVEAFCNGYRQQAPGLAITLLRFPSILGPTVDSPMARFLKEPAAPVLLGFDPLMQVIHESDAVGAIVHAVNSEQSGPFNIAAEGILPLLKLVHMAGKMPLPVFHLFAYWGTDIAALIAAKPSSGAQIERYNPIAWDSLRYSCVADLTEMTATFGFIPHYTAEETLREFAAAVRLSAYQTEGPDLAADEQRLRDTLERRRRLRERRIQPEPSGYLMEEDEEFNQPEGGSV